MTEVLSFQNIYIDPNPSSTGTFKLSPSLLGYRNPDIHREFNIADIEEISIGQDSLDVKMNFIKIKLKNDDLILSGFTEEDVNDIYEVISSQINQKSSLKKLTYSTEGHHGGNINLNLNKGLSILNKENNSIILNIPTRHISNISNPSSKTPNDYLVEVDVDLIEANFHESKEESYDFISDFRFTLLGEDNDDGLSSFKVNSLEPFLTMGIDDVSSSSMTIEDCPMLLPRGHFDIGILNKNSTIKFHGKTFDFSVKMSNIANLISLNKSDGVHQFLLIELKSYIRHGGSANAMTKYLLFQINRNRLTEKAESSESLSLYTHLLNSLTSSSGISANLAHSVKATLFGDVEEDEYADFSMSCVHKSDEGSLYFCSDAIIFLTRPIILLPIMAIRGVEFARSETTGATKYFDVKFHMDKGYESVEFSHFAKADYPYIVSFLEAMKISIKNITPVAEPISKISDMAGDDDDEEEDFEMGEDTDSSSSDESGSSSGSDESDGEQDVKRVKV